MAALEKNNIYTARIEGYSSEGLGIARIDGQVVFVHGAVRGELCRVLVMKVLKNAAFGKVTELLEPSPERREPDCPYYGRCGGCDFRHLSYREELWAKRQRVQDALTRLGGSDVEVEEILGAADPLYYRNKSQYPVSAGKVGFYRARTHDVVDIEHCLIQKPQADAAAAALRDYMRDFAVPSYDEKTGRGLLRHLYVRTNRRGESLVCVLANGERLPHEEELVGRLRRAVPDCVGVVLGVNTRRGNTILGERYRTLWGADTLEDELCGLTFRLSVPSFYQVNRDQAEVLYRKAVEYAGLTGGELVVDLYCGAGTITQVMAGGAGRVIGAEIVPEAIEDAREEQDSVGGVIECAAVGLPAGIGSPMLDSVESRLASILFGVPAVKGVEFGAGFAFAALRGSHANDPFYEENGAVKTETNNNGGVLGGITSGMPLIVRACIKPTPSIGMAQDTLNLRTGKVEPLSIHGRHDPCIVTRAAPVIEAACAVALADLLREANGYA